MAPKPSRGWTACVAGGWVLLGCFALGAAWLGDVYSGPSFRLFGINIYRIGVWQGLYGLGFVGYALLLLAFRRRPVRTRTIVIAAVLLRLVLLLCPPNNDCNRYIWEGRIQGEGFSPYVQGPNDPVLEPLRDEIWQGINKKHYTTIYPPLAEIEFRLLSIIHYGVKSPQVGHTLLDIAVVLMLVGLLRRLGQPEWYAAIYAFCPLVLASFAHAGHNDSLMILGLLTFLAAGVRRRWVWAGLALGLAILAKTTPVILLALLVRRSKTAIAVALVTVGLGYLFYAEAGWKLFDVLFDFPTQSSFNNVYELLRVWMNQAFGDVLLARGRLYIVLAILVCAAAYRAWRPRELVADVRWLLAIVVLVLPIVHFWYLTWVLALVALRPRGYGSWVLLVGMMVLYWQAEWAYQAGGRWRMAPWAVVLIWAPFYLAWLGETLWLRRLAVRRRRK